MSNLIPSWMLCGPDGPTGRFSLVTAHVKGNTVCVFGVVKNRYQTCLFYRLELCVLVIVLPHFLTIPYTRDLLKIRGSVHCFRDQRIHTCLVKFD